MRSHGSSMQRSRKRSASTPRHVVSGCGPGRCARHQAMATSALPPTISGRVSGMSHSGPMRGAVPGRGELGRRADAERPPDLMRVEEGAGVR